MKSISSIAIMAAGLMTLAAASVHAENTDSRTNHPNPGKLQWLQMVDDLSASEYLPYQSDKHDPRSALRVHSKSAAESMELTKRAGLLAVGTADAATSLSTRQDVTFDLNGNNSFAFEVRDPTDKGRILLLSYRMKW